jgi:hypothetical protein
LPGMFTPKYQVGLRDESRVRKSMQLRSPLFLRGAVASNRVHRRRATRVSPQPQECSCTLKE